MLIDLFLLVVLGAALAWSSTASSKRVVAGALVSLARFGKALLRSHLGRLLVLLAIATLFQWSAQVATLGWSSLDPSVATGEVEEEERCHAWQHRINGATRPDEFAPSELVCPVGGGHYTQDARGRVSCGIHGEAL